MRNFLKGSLVALLMVAAACDGANPTSSLSPSAARLAKGGSGGGGSTQPSTSVTLLTANADAPAISSPVSFYAVQGQDRQGVLEYADNSGGNGTHRFLRLRIRPRTQITRPDGTPLAAGDSILITISLIDPVKLVAQFEPSGLRFTGHDPANLTMWFTDTDHDLNDDGVVNNVDTGIQQTFSIFRQAFAGAPWVRIQSVVNTGADEVTAAIPGFSNYVIAF